MIWNGSLIPAFAWAIAFGPRVVRPEMNGVDGRFQTLKVVEFRVLFAKRDDNSLQKALLRWLQDLGANI